MPNNYLIKQNIMMEEFLTVEQLQFMPHTRALLEIHVLHEYEGTIEPTDEALVAEYNMLAQFGMLNLLFEGEFVWNEDRFRGQNGG